MVKLLLDTDKPGTCPFEIADNSEFIILITNYFILPHQSHSRHQSYIIMEKLSY